MLLMLMTTGCFFKTVHPTVEETAPEGTFGHERWAAVLAEHVDEAGLVDYAGLQADRETLDRYVAQLAAASPDSHPDLFPTEDAALAYWINAYNALAVTAVIDRPGLQTVVDKKVEFFYRTRYPLGGEPVSLYKLENGIVRERFAEPRIHFALNCQSASCPQFPARPFPAEGLDAMLAEVTVAFVNDPDNVRVQDGVVHVSQIFEWYAKDFEAAGGALGFVRQYRPELPADAEVRYIPYDWTLIAQPGRRP